MFEAIRVKARTLSQDSNPGLTGPRVLAGHHLQGRPGRPAAERSRTGATWQRLGLGPAHSLRTPGPCVLRTSDPQPPAKAREQEST